MNHDWLVSIKIGFPIEHENLLALDTGWLRTGSPVNKWRWMVIFPWVPIWATHHPCHKSSTSLVVSNMAFIFHNIWDVILPIDEVISFKMVIAPPISSLWALKNTVQNTLQRLPFIMLISTIFSS